MTHRTGWLELAPEDQELFARHAEAALQRRDAGFFRARRALWLDWLLTGGIGLFGMLVLGWSAATALVLLLVSFWLGWFADLVLWLLRARALAISYRHAGDDLRFWQIVAILRGKRRQPPDVRGHPSLVLSLVVDLVAGGVTLALLWRGLGEAGVDLVDLATSPTLVAGVAAIALLGIVPALRARLRPAADGSVTLPVFAVGQRGIGLLVLSFALMAAGGGTLAAATLLGCAYAFYVVMASIELVWGLPAMRAEIEWLQRERAKAGVGPAAATEASD